MTVLAKAERAALDKAVQEGRRVAELAAGHELSRLGVTDDRVPAYLTEPEKVLRRDLRDKARQLGDGTSAGSTLPLLTADVAYEQWHRLLFARFLEVNGLLRHPTHAVSLSLAECEELADDLGEPDGWAVAARFASEILPGVFRPTDPCVGLRFAHEDLAALEMVVMQLPAMTLLAEDALGWVYQFWQTSKKDAVNKAGNKIGGADISPVTQLFTENYMVRFLLENSLGAWWAARHPESPLVSEWDYLRLLDDGTPAAGTFDSWPPTAAEVTVMDPCCGSGHFLVAAFGMLWRMRAEEEGLAPAQAQEAVLRDNLFGLELDPRCTQIAVFNLVLEAWKQGGYRLLPAPNVACSGIPVRGTLGEWEDIAGDDVGLRATMTRLHSQFRNADSLGSLIDPAADSRRDDLLSADLDDVRDTLAAIVGREGVGGTVLGDVVSDVGRAASLLSRSYVLLATNVPYLKRSRQDGDLAGFMESRYPLAKQDIATSFLARMSGGWGITVAAVSPHGWTFMSWYKKFRRQVLQTWCFHIVGILGTGAFSDVTGEVVNVDLMVYSPAGPPREILSIDSSRLRGTEKQLALRESEVRESGVSEQLESLDSRISLGVAASLPSLQEIAGGYAGICSGDYPRFGRCFWEIQDFGSRWARQQSTVKSTVPYGGREHAFRWDGGHGDFRQFVEDRLGAKNVGAWIRGTGFAGRQGVAISSMGELHATLYTGELFDNNTAVVMPGKHADLPAIWAYCSSEEFRAEVRTIDQSIKVTNSTFVKVPFDEGRWRSIAEKAGPLPEPHSDDPTQWLFLGRPDGSAEPLQVAVARLLGYRWPDQAPDDLDDLADDDGIVCIPAVAGERAAVDRLRELLDRAYGPASSSSLLDRLLVDAGGKPGDIEGWLRDAFFKHHCKTFHSRPFVWHVWDGRKDGFSALVNYHRLDHQTLTKLVFTTLGSWVDRQRSDAADGVTGAESRLGAAEDLRRRLRLILDGEKPYDVYVRWKRVHEQPVGWEPDLDDGVRLNIRPFVTAEVLRARVNVKWEKDRGKNPDGSERLNHLHVGLVEKQAARAAHDRETSP